MNWNRLAQNRLLELSSRFPAVVVVGPRQVGKTTLVSFWRTATGQEADLIFDRGSERIAIEVKANSGTNPHDARKLESNLDDIGANREFMVGIGTPCEQLTAKVSNVSLDLSPCWLPSL